jgi:hypothetical protein
MEVSESCGFAEGGSARGWMWCGRTLYEEENAPHREDIDSITMGYAPSFPAHISPVPSKL